MSEKQRSFVLLLLLPVLLLCGSAEHSEAVRFPGDGFVAGWFRDGPPRLFNRKGLYGHINGGSELFLEAGFEELKVQRYKHKTDAGGQLAVETYRMDSAEAALAIYLLNCGVETPVPGLAERNSGDRYQYTIMKGYYFVKVNNFNGNTALQPVMQQLARLTLAQIDARTPADLFAQLPTRYQVDGSKLLLRGLYSFQSVYSLGEGDMLQLKNKIFAVTAQYSHPELGTYNLIQARYPDDPTAAETFAFIRAHLDSYITVLTENAKMFTFKDYSGRFGTVTLNNNSIRIAVNLIKLIKD